MTEKILVSLRKFAQAASSVPSSSSSGPESIIVTSGYGADSEGRGKGWTCRVSDAFGPLIPVLAL